MKQQQVETTSVGSKKRRNQDDLIVQLFHEERDDYSLTNLATTIRALLPRQHPALSDVLHAIALFLHNAAHSTTTPWYDRTIDAITYSNIIHALTKIPMRVRNRDDAARRILSHLHSSVVARQFHNVADAQALSTVAWSLARLAEEENETKQQQRQSCHNGPNNNVTTTTYRDLLHNLVVTNLSQETVARLMQSGQPQAIANLLWACATLDVASPMLLDAVNEHCGTKLIAAVDQKKQPSGTRRNSTQVDRPHGVVVCQVAVRCATLFCRP
jgi:hypothetical protein